MSPKLMKGTVASALLCLMLGAITQLQHQLDQRLDHKSLQMEALAHLPPGEQLKPAMLGYHHLGADLLWLQLIQVLGKKKNTDDEYEWMYHALDVITTLDTQYVYAYYVGGVVLTSLADRVDLSNKILEKGHKENPSEWDLPFLLGYNHYFILGDPAKAADYIASAARLPGGPAYLPGLATRMYAEANSPEVALQFIEALWRQTQDQNIRDMLEKRAKEVVIERDIGLLELAVQRYRARNGYFPRKVEDLLTSGHIAQIPQEPFGGSYQLDSKTGEVTSSTHPDRLKVFRLDKRGKA